MTTELAAIFRRDLTKLLQEVQGFPDDDSIWLTPAGMNNSPGNLVLHLEGNLREYIGRQIGGLPYQRIRPIEFSSTGLPKEQLKARLVELREAIPAVIGGLSSEQFQKEYPEQVLEIPLATEEFLIHLYGHLNWHLGELDYLRRALSGSGAIERVGLLP